MTVQAQAKRRKASVSGEPAGSGRRPDMRRRGGCNGDTMVVKSVGLTQEHLLGVITLRDLILADSGTRLEEIMDERVISLKLDDKDDTIAEHFAKYAVTAIPVVDENDRMQGTIIFKNLLDVVAPHLGK